MKYLPPLLLALLIPATVLAEIRLTDDLGREVVLDEPARRVITLVPHATELMFGIGAGERIIATVDYSDYPAAAQRIPRVGDHNSLNTEAIVSLGPDLLIAFTTAPNLKDVGRLRELGFTVFHSDPQDFPGIARTLRDFGRMTGREAAAERAATDFENEIAWLRRTYGSKEPLSVFYEVWHDPIFTLSGDSYISDIVELCGGRNIFADLPGLSPQVSLEAVIDADPQVIVRSPGESETESPWRQWPQLRAVQNEALVSVDPDEMHRPTPSLLDGASQLCEDLDQLRSEAY